MVRQLRFVSRDTGLVISKFSLGGRDALLVVY
jgi:hypothetical protein